MLNGFGTVVNSLGKRAKPYLPQVRARACVSVRSSGTWYFSTNGRVTLMQGLQSSFMCMHAQLVLFPWHTGVRNHQVAPQQQVSQDPPAGR